jgi:hypothetical protein
VTTRIARRVTIGMMRAIGTATPIKNAVVTLVGTSNTIETGVV